MTRMSEIAASIEEDIQFAASLCERPKTKFTPGPWRVGPVDDTIVSAPDRSEIAAIDGDYNEPDLWPIMEANARLIAAAPEMYAELERLDPTNPVLRKARGER